MKYTMAVHYEGRDTQFHILWNGKDEVDQRLKSFMKSPEVVGVEIFQFSYAMNREIKWNKSTVPGVQENGTVSSGAID